MKYSGLDNYGRPRQEYLDILSSLSDDDLLKKCSDMVWLSGYAGNNPRSDYHWQADACYDECVKRSRQDIFEMAIARSRS